MTADLLFVHGGRSGFFCMPTLVRPVVLTMVRRWVLSARFDAHGLLCSCDATQITDKAVASTVVFRHLLRSKHNRFGESASSLIFCALRPAATVLRAQPHVTLRRSQLSPRNAFHP
jgi:hypothetical protein